MRRFFLLLAVALLSGIQAAFPQGPRTPVSNLYPTGDLNGLLNSIGGFSPTINNVGGGNSASLEAVPTVGVAAPVIRQFILASTGELQIWALLPSTAANDVGHRRPNDYNASTNAKVWTQTGSAVFVGSQSGGVRLVWGSVETFAGQTAAVSIQGNGTMNGLEVHTTGNQGIAIIGQSDTGAAAGKFVQSNHYDFPSAFFWRNTATSGSDAPLISLKSWGVADLLQANLPAGQQTLFDVNGAVHPPHMADSATQNDSIYFSTTSGKLCYKDTGGAVHPLY